MLKNLTVSTILLCLAGSGQASENLVLIETSEGNITIELDFDKAPITSANFIKYVESGFFNNTIFHRVIPGFVIQGGGFEHPMNRKETLPPIENEADNGLKNLRGTLSMARTSDPNSATSQFFINLVNNDFLDYKSKDVAGWGYAVFAEITSGIEVIDRIASIPTTSFNGMQDVPTTPITINNVSLISGNTE
jgi:Peptidyl-prolyl cis-trans isomerase (rotamase) - cyclophilin family